MAEYDADGWQQVLEHEPPGVAEDGPSDGASKPWYRNRVLLALWALMVALLVTLVIYGFVELSRGGGETTGPATTTSSTTPARSSTTSPVTTTPSTTTETPLPPSETPEQTPQEVPPPANNSPAPAEPPRHHHHFHLPHLS